MKGVILAAGKGDRIRDVTYGVIPKELLPIGNVPTIRFPIESLKLVNINYICLVIAPNGKHSIVQGLQGGGKFGVDLCYVVQEKGEDELSGIGKAILSVKRWVGQEDFIVACGDTILCNFHSDNPFNCLNSLMKIHESKSPLATIVLDPISDDPTRFGVAKFRKLEYDEETSYGELERLIEKPTLEIANDLKINGHNYVVAGYYIFKPKIFSYIEKTKPGYNNEIQITDALILAMESGEKVYGVIHGKNRGYTMYPYEYWDVGIPEAYKEANKRLIDLNVEKMFAMSN